MPGEFPSYYLWAWTGEWADPSLSGVRGGIPAILKGFWSTSCILVRSKSENVLLDANGNDRSCCLLRR